MVTMLKISLGNYGVLYSRIDSIRVILLHVAEDVALKVHQPQTGNGFLFATIHRDGIICYKSLSSYKSHR